MERLLAADRRQAALRRLVEAPQPAGAVRLNCPHCQNPIELVVDQQEEVVCPSCGSSFHLDAGRTQTWSKDKLPTLGKFSLLSRLGFGAFGTVYKAFDSELQRSVALKIPRSGTLGGAEDEDRFFREARNAAQLRHAGIVPVFEVGRSEQFPYIVSELVEGVTLADALSGRQFGFREAALLVQQLAEALDYSHKQGVVHRDLKPSNIMLSANDVPRIMDFGLAKREAGEITMTMDGQVLGTPAYMSPEQASGKAHEVDGRSDVYSLGVILFELLTGELPFRGNPRMLLHQVLHNEPRTPRSLNDRVPRDLETICLKAIAKEPKRRYQSADEFGHDLGRYLNGEPIHARPVGRVERGWRWCKRQPVVAALLTAVILSLATGTVVSTRFALLARQREAEAISETTRADKEMTWARRKAAQTEQQLHIATALRFATESAAVREEHPVRSLLLAMEGIRATTDFSEPVVYAVKSQLLASLTELKSRPLVGHEFAVNCQMATDGQTLASVGRNGTLLVWNLAQDAPSPTVITGHKYRVRGFDLSAHGQRLVSTDEDANVGIWDLGTNAPATRAVRSMNDYLELSPEDNATLKDHGLAKVWISSDDRWPFVQSFGLGWFVRDLVTGRTLRLSESYEDRLSLTPDEQNVLFTSGGKLRRRTVKGLASSDEETVLVSLPQESGSLSLAAIGNHWAAVTKFAKNESFLYIPDAPKESSGSSSSPPAMKDDLPPTITVVDLRSGAESSPIPNQAGIAACDISLDGRWLVVSTDEPATRAWRLPLQTSVSAQADLDLRGELVAASSDTRWVLIRQANEDKVLWDLAAADPQQAAKVISGLPSLRSGEHFTSSGGFEYGALTNDGRRLVGVLDGTIRVWNLSDPPFELDTRRA